MSEHPTTQETLARAAGGDEDAANELYPVVYDELRRIANARLRGERSGHTLQPTALVNEAFIRVIGQPDANVNSKSHFVAIASLAMQRILVDHARAKGTQKRGGDRGRQQLHEDMPANVIDDEEAIIALAEAVDKLTAIDERKATVVRLRMLGGLSVLEVASVLNVARSTIDADWAAAKDWLKEELGLDVP